MTAWPIITFDADLFAKQMTTTPPAVCAAGRLRTWVNHEHDERPTRGELRHDVETLLDERLRLIEQVADLEADRDRERRVRLELADERTALREERDELRAALDAQSVDTAMEKDLASAFHVDAGRYRALLRKAHAERDAWQAEAKCAHGKLDHLRDELKLALDEVERLLGALQRAKTSAAARPSHVRLTTTTTRIEVPRGVVASDNDV